MSARQRIRTAWGCLAILLLCRLVIAEVSMWTDARGATLVAAFVRVEGDSVVLKTEQEETITVLLSSLSEPDQARARTLHAAATGAEAAGTEDQEDSNRWLPVWNGGPYPHAFAVVQDPAFDFVILGDGGGRLFVKDRRGEIVTPPIWIGGFGLDHGKPGTNRRHGRPVVEVDNKNLQPLLNPRSIVLSGEAKDGVRFERKYTFSPGTVRAEFSFEDPRNIEFQSSGRTGVRFMRYNPIQDAGPEKQKAMLTSWKTTLHHPNGRTEFDYWESMDAFPRHIRRAVVQGPWEGREITIDFLQATAAGQIYKGQPLWRGYGYMLRTGGPRPSDRRLGVEISVK